jgi:dTDP-4-dehydrorhamnose 3,5-epimerase
MKIEPTPFRDVYVITPDAREDVRGFFMETFRQDELEKVGITEDFVQDNHSRSLKRNTIRGLHFQWQEPMSKIIRVTRGAAFVVAVDLRKGSPTLGKWHGIELSAENKKQVYTPAGFARGFQTLTDECEVQYKCSALYNPEAQGGIAWNDPEAAIGWPIKEVPILSEKDAQLLTLTQWLSTPESDIFSF